MSISKSQNTSLNSYFSGSTPIFFGVAGATALLVATVSRYAIKEAVDSFTNWKVYDASLRHSKSDRIEITRQEVNKKNIQLIKEHLNELLDQGHLNEAFIKLLMLSQFHPKCPKNLEISKPLDFIELSEFFAKNSYEVLSLISMDLAEQEDLFNKTQHCADVSMSKNTIALETTHFQIRDSSELNVMIELIERKKKLPKTNIKVLNDYDIALEKYVETLKEIESISEDFECSPAELAIRALSYLSDKTNSELVLTNVSIYQILETSREMLQSELLKEEREAEKNKTRSSKTIRANVGAAAASSVARREAPATTPTNVGAVAAFSKDRNQAHEQNSNAKKKQLTNENHQKQHNKYKPSQVNEAIMTEDGFRFVTGKIQPSPADKIPKIDLGRYVFLDDRVLRWSYDEEDCVDSFLNGIMNFPDKRGIRRYEKMSRQELIDQYRRHYIPSIEILLAQSWFLKHYAKKVFNENRSNSEDYIFVVETYLDKKQLGIEILTVGLNQHEQTTSMHHCYLKREYEIFNQDNGKISLDFSASTQEGKNKPLKRRPSNTVPKILMQKPGDFPKIQVSCIDPFTNQIRTIIFRPLDDKSSKNSIATVV